MEDFTLEETLSLALGSIVVAILELHEKSKTEASKASQLLTLKSTRASHLQTTNSKKIQAANIAAVLNGHLGKPMIREGQTIHIQLQEAEERRRKKLDELHAIEMAHHDFIGLKTRMESEIKDLLLKMESWRRNVNA